MKKYRLKKDLQFFKKGSEVIIQEKALRGRDSYYVLCSDGSWCWIDYADESELVEEVIVDPPDMRFLSLSSPPINPNKEERLRKIIDAAAREINELLGEQE